MWYNLKIVIMSKQEREELLLTLHAVENAKSVILGLKYDPAWNVDRWRGSDELTSEERSEVDRLAGIALGLRKALGEEVPVINGAVRAYKIFLRSVHIPSLSEEVTDLEKSRYLRQLINVQTSDFNPQ